MILVVDVGNTNTVLGIYIDRALVASWRIATEHHRTADEYGLLITGFFAHAGLDTGAVEAVVVSSVVPPLTSAYETLAGRYFGAEALVVGPGVKTGLPIRYENPKEVGADRIVNAVAAVQKYEGPMIIADFGTATTFDAISAGGEYLGGAICPGIGISTEALFERCAKLPRVEIAHPKSVIGKTTVHSMQAGIYYGTVGQVREIVSRMAAELGGDVKVIATGGLAEAIAADVPEVSVVDPNLTLEGLRIIYERNRMEKA